MLAPAVFRPNIVEHPEQMLANVLPLCDTFVDVIKGCALWSYICNHPITTIQFNSITIYGCEDRADIYEEIRLYRQATLARFGVV